ncbi:MAG: hypothetical protein WA777_04650 [Rhodanobacter sp.]
MTPIRQAAHGFWWIWAAPTALAVLSVFGLLSALLGEHMVWKALAWVALGIPVVTSSWFAWLRPRR